MFSFPKEERFVDIKPKHQAKLYCLRSLPELRSSIIGLARRRELNSQLTPGPGSYDVKLEKTKIGSVFSKLNKKPKIDLEVPGVGHYKEINKGTLLTRKKIPSFTLSKTPNTNCF